MITRLLKLAYYASSVITTLHLLWKAYRRIRNRSC